MIKNKEAEICTDNVTAGQRHTEAQTQHEDKTDEESKSDENTDSVSDKTETPSLVNPETKTGQLTGEESEKSLESRDGDNNPTSGDDATTDLNSAKDGESGEEEKDELSKSE